MAPVDVRKDVYIKNSIKNAASAGNWINGVHLYVTKSTSVLNIELMYH